MFLENWINQARSHWKQHLPEMYARLEKAGQLEAKLREAANRTYSAVTELEDSGMTAQEAFQMAREDHLFLRPEHADNPEPDGLTQAMWKEMANNPPQ